MGMKCFYLAVLVALSFVGGCSDSPDPGGLGGWHGTVDTLASGRIIVTNPDQSGWPPGGRLTLVERFRLGALDSGGPDMFGEIRDVELGPDGALFVLDAQASEIRVFDEGGRYLRTIGRAGEGPGELNRPAGMAVDSRGTLWVMNWQNARYSGFDPTTGELRREVRRIAAFASFPWPGAFDRTDRLVDVALDANGTPAIIRLDTAFVPTDTMGLPEVRPEHRVAFRRGGRMMMSMLDPFAPQPSWAPAPDGGIVLGEGREYLLHRINFDGDTVMSMALQRVPIRVTAAERDSALAAFQANAEFAEGATPDRRPRANSTKPAHGSIFIDDEDHTWVRAEVRGQWGWDLMDSRGRYLGRIPVPLPEGARLATVRGGRLVLVGHVDGVPTIVVYDVLPHTEGG
jgi:6-bladed beta-propeller